MNKNKDKNTYNRTDYVMNYSLTEEEYLLLPYLARMSYAKTNFSRFMGDLKEVGNELILHMHLPECYDEFFKDSGCEVKRNEQGTTECEEDETVTITRVSDKVSYKSNSGLDFRVNRYLYDLATAKAIVFEDVLKKHLERRIKAINTYEDLELDQITPGMILKRITSFPLKDMQLEPYNRDYLIMYQLRILMEELEGNYFTIKRPSDEYIDFLRRKGYMVNEDEHCISIYKPSKKDNKELNKSYKEDLQNP